MKEIEISDSLKDSIVGYYSGKLDQKQAEELIHWVEESEGNRNLFIRLGELYHTSGLQSKKEFDANAAWSVMMRKIKDRDIRPLAGRELRIPVSLLYQAAAVLLLFILIGAGSIFIFKKPTATDQAAWFETVAPKGSRSFITLADGSMVWLNAVTKLRYRSDYGKTNRDLYLEGEAYFSVAKNKNIPFHVNTSEIRVTATGTAFNVKAYNDENYIETTLEEGSVQIDALKSKASRQEQASITLRPNQKALFIKTTGSIAVNEKNANKQQVERENIAPKRLLPVKVLNVTDTKLYTSWKDTRWIFKNEKLADLAPKLERRYDVSITFRDTVLRSYAFTGTLKEESLEQVLNAIRLSAPIGFEIKQKNLVLFEDRSIKSRFLRGFRKNK